MRITLLILSIFCSFISYAQQKEIDSIKQVLPAQEALDQVKSFNELSWYYKNSNLDSALYFAKSALDISRKIESQTAIAASFNSIASVLEAQGHLDSAIFLHTKSLQIKEALKDTIGMANSLNNLGIAYDEIGKYNLSLESYFQALRFYESKSDQPFDVAMVLGNIGIVYKKQKEYPKVLEYYEKALKIYEEVGSSFGITVTKGNISGVLLLTGGYREAISYSEEALEGYKNAGYTRYIPYMLGNIGIAYDSLHQPEKARNYHLEAKDLHMANENWLELSNTLTALASNYRRTNEFIKGISSAKEAYHYAVKIEALDFQAKALLELSKNQSKAGEYKDGLTSLFMYKALNDSLFEETKTKQVFELQTQYETEKKEQQIALQQAEISEQNAKIARSRTLLIASTIFTILIIIIGALWRNRIKKKQQLSLQEALLKAKEAEINATISSQEKERSRYARDLHDGFGQMISVLNMNLKRLEDSPKPDERQNVFDTSSKVIKEMYEELKNICFDLMPQTLVKNGLESALREFSDRVNQSGRLFIEVNVFGLDTRLDQLQEISLFRICQEWINNIMKYGNAEKIILQITKDTNEITLLIEDDGMGFEKQLLTSGKGNGWRNLNTRTNLIQGEIDIETQPGKRGSSLILNAPAIRKTITENTIQVV